MKITNNYSFMTNMINRYEKNIQNSSLRMTTGKKINRAADDAAGLAIAEKLKSQIKGINAANKNIETANSLVTIADKTLESVTEIAQNINDLYLEKENGLLSQEDKDAIQVTIDQYSEQISDIISSTKFNNVSVFSGTELSIQTGANTGDVTKIKISKFETGLDFSDLAKTQTSISNLTAERSKMGAYENVLERKMGVNAVTVENLESARSRIEDTDIDEEYINYTNNITLQELAQSMLSQQVNNHRNLINSFFS